MQAYVPAVCVEFYHGADACITRASRCVSASIRFLCSKRVLDAVMRAAARAGGVRNLFQSIDNQASLILILPVFVLATYSSYRGTGWWVDLNLNHQPEKNPAHARALDAVFRGFLSRAGAVLSMLVLFGCSEGLVASCVMSGLIATVVSCLRTSTWKPNQQVGLHVWARVLDAGFRAISRGMSASGIERDFGSQIDALAYALFVVTALIAAVTSYKVTAWWDRKTVTTEAELDKKLRPAITYVRLDSALRGMARGATFFSLMKITLELAGDPLVIKPAHYAVFAIGLLMVASGFLLGTFTSKERIDARIETTLAFAERQGRIVSGDFADENRPLLNAANIEP